MSTVKELIKAMTISRTHVIIDFSNSHLKLEGNGEVAALVLIEVHAAVVPERLPQTSSYPTTTIRDPLIRICVCQKAHL